MAWEVWWALVLGFALSTVVQALVPRSRMERALGGSGLRPMALATGARTGPSNPPCERSILWTARLRPPRAGIPRILVTVTRLSENLRFARLFSKTLSRVCGPLSRYLSPRVRLVRRWVGQVSAFRSSAPRKATQLVCPAQR